MKQNLNHLAQVERLAKERADKERSRNLPRRAGDPDPLAEPGGPLPRLAFEDGQMRALPRPPKRPYEQETFDEQERLRNPEPKCSNATCPGPSPDKPFIAYDDGSSVCHACGGETPAAPSHKNEAPNHEDGPDRRRAQEYGDDENLDLYTIDDEEMPGATEHQRWWANNRMNQAMVLADCMGYDRDDPDGFSISADEVLKVKHVLRRVCPLAAPDAPDATVEDNDDASLMGSPTLWAILIGLEVIAQGPDGFQMPTKTKQQIATLEGLNEYLYKFQGRSTPRFEEALAVLYRRQRQGCQRCAAQARQNQGALGDLALDRSQQRTAPGQDQQAQRADKAEQRLRPERRSLRRRHDGAAAGARSRPSLPAASGGSGGRATFQARGSAQPAARRSHQGARDGLDFAPQPIGRRCGPLGGSGGADDRAAERFTLTGKCRSNCD